MNKTIDINLAGVFFHIDEKAYAILKKYLDDLRKTFADTEGKDDILADIEARIAELLNDRKNNKDQVIETEDIEAIIVILGKPEDYVIDDESKSYQEKSSKRLFRDGEDSYVGGVASGLAHYFGLDVSWLRILWAVLIFFSGGSFLVIYILFWILIPEAKTTAEKLQMKGEPVTVENIEKKIKDEVNSLADKVKNVDYEKASNTLKKKSKSFFDNFSQLVLSLIKITGKIAGVFLILIASLSLFGITLGFIVSNVVNLFSIFPFEFISISFFQQLPLWLLLLLIFCTAGIPMLFLLMLGIKLVSPKANPFGFWGRLILLGIWSLSLIVLIILGTIEARSHLYEYTSTEQLDFPAPINDTLYLRKKKLPDFQDRFTQADEFDIIVDSNGEKHLLLENVSLGIASTDKDSLYLSIHKEANGASYVLAQTNARSIAYQTNKTENELYLSHHLTVPAHQKLNDQEVDVKLYLPEGQKIYIENDLVSILGWNIPNDRDFIRRGLAGHYWEMKANSLRCLDCEEK